MDSFVNFAYDHEVHESLKEGDNDPWMRNNCRGKQPVMGDEVNGSRVLVLIFTRLCGLRSHL